MKHVITPNWPAPTRIKAYTTLRTGGVSKNAYAEWNLATHVGDDPTHVAANRELLTQTLSLPNEPIWIEQTHSTIVIPAKPEMRDKEADASFTHEPHQVCAVLTADCLPLLICNRAGTHVAAIHAGWRGLANGIIEETLKALQLPTDDLLVWLGPAIGPRAFEVGEEVRDLFLKHSADAKQAFVPSPQGRWLADLYHLAKLRLINQGISHIHGGEYCTYSDEKRFFSYRRDNVTGRMASLIWIA